MPERQLSLNVGTPMALLLNCHREPWGWVVTFKCRLDTQLWADVEGTHYERLTTHELVDVMDAELEHALLPSR